MELLVRAELSDFEGCSLLGREVGDVAKNMVGEPGVDLVNECFRKCLTRVWCQVFDFRLWW